MRVITFEDIASLGIAPSTCFDWMQKALINKPASILPPKTSLKHQEGVFCNVMPSIIPMDGSYYGGVKVVTRYPNRAPSLESRILLMDANSGEFLAIMDGTWITTMRTGAVATHSIKLLAKNDFSMIGMMGLGNVSRSTLLILADQIPDREFHIKLLKYKDQAENFAARFKEFDNIRFSFVDTPEEMVKESDVVISGATYLSDNICPDEFYEEGVLVIPIHTRGFTNCDLFFDKVYADDKGHVCNFKYFDRFKQFAEISQVVSGDAPGRENDKERILAYNIGISIHDIYYAASIYKTMKERGLLDSTPDVDIKDPTTKFWV